ncbi:MAG: cytochrome c oxidase subunit [Blastocatellia bacterium]|jgi:cytochrome c oxidase subunit 3|nr:cytochrome c oxidase subunit [Blastocatellia bacterium]
MATTVTNTESVIPQGLGAGSGSRGGNGFRRNGGKGGPDPTRYYADRYRLGMYVALAGVVMLFTALTSAYIVRAASSNDWRPIAMPSILWLSTLVIVVSSFVLETARRAVKQQRDGVYGRWLIITTLLGITFLASQLMAWRQLARQGVYLSSNPHSSFFYLLTAAHGVHLLGGILALGYLLLRTRKTRDGVAAESKRVGAVDAVSIYWHFMDGLWVYLFLLLFFWK